jgi:hypothetical protein
MAPLYQPSLGLRLRRTRSVEGREGTYNSPIAGQRETIVYSFTDDNIEYRVHVIDMRDRANEAANLLGEAQFLFQDKKRVLMDAFGRVDRQYGRKLTVDLPNNAGRSMGAFYFINGRIVSLQATVLPANGDYETPETGRFIDSITFFTVRAADDAIELPPPG